MAPRTQSKRAPEIRFRSGRLRYYTCNAGAGLAESEFTRLVVSALHRGRNVRTKRHGFQWLAAATSVAVPSSGDSPCSTEYEVLVCFEKRTRLSKTSDRLALMHSEWQLSVESIPAHGKSRKEYFRDEIQRWSRMSLNSHGCFGTGFETIGIERLSYNGTSRGGSRALGFHSVPVWNERSKSPRAKMHVPFACECIATPAYNLAYWKAVLQTAEQACAQRGWLFR